MMIFNRFNKRARVTCVLALSLGAGLTLSGCGGDDEVHEIFQVAGANASDLQATVDAFRSALGANNGAGAPAASGRREVNWDGIPLASLDPFPGNFFNTTSARGIVFSTPGTRMKVSGDPGSASFEFADITALLPSGQPWGPVEFGTFSASRFFATVDSTVTEISFFVPGTAAPATVSAFGAVFADVDVADATLMEFYSANNTLIYRHKVPVARAKSEGLTFVGVRLDPSRPAARVRIVAGTHPVNSPFQDPPPDGVGIDDVIFAEPVAR